MEPDFGKLLAHLPDWCDSGHFPSRVWLLSGPGGDHSCFRISKWDVTGLAVFSTEHAAYRFGEFLPDVEGLMAAEFDLSEAIHFAQEIGSPVNGLLLLDRMTDPQVFHF